MGLTVSVAICTFNRADLLRRTLAQLRGTDIPPDTSVEFVVVNNHCTDSTDSVIADASQFLPLRRIYEPAPGLSHARNAAIQATSGDYILFTDDDVLVDPGWLREFANTCSRYPDAAVVGGVIEPWFAEPPDQLLTQVFPTLATGFCGVDHGPAERVLDSEYVYGANMAFRRRAIEGLLFHPDLGPKETNARTGDDVEFIRRVRQSGGRVVWSPLMKVQHYVPPERMTVAYQAKWLTEWARADIRQSGIGRLEGRFVVADAPVWLWKSAVWSFARYRMASVAGSRRNALLRLREHALFKGWLLEYRDMARQKVAVAS